MRIPKPKGMHGPDFHEYQGEVIATDRPGESLVLTDSGHFSYVLNEWITSKESADAP